MPDESYAAEVLRRAGVIHTSPTYPLDPLEEEDPDEFSDYASEVLRRAHVVKDYRAIPEEELPPGGVIPGEREPVFPAKAAAAPPGAGPPPLAAPAPAPSLESLPGLMPPQRMGPDTSQAAATPALPVPPGPAPQPGTAEEAMIAALQDRSTWGARLQNAGIRAAGQVRSAIAGMPAQLGRMLEDPGAMEAGAAKYGVPYRDTGLDTVGGKLMDLSVAAQASPRVQKALAGSSSEGHFWEQLRREPVMALLETGIELTGSVGAMGIAALATGGNPAAVISTAFMMESGNKYSEELAKGIDPRLAADTAAVYGVGSAMLESLPVLAAMRRIPGGGSHIIRRVAEMMAAEGLTESLQGAESDMASYLMWGRDQGMEVADVINKENFLKWIDEGMRGSLGGMAYGVMGEATRRGRDVSEEAQAHLDEVLGRELPLTPAEELAAEELSEEEQARATEAARDVTPEEEAEARVADPEEVTAEQPVRPSRQLRARGPFQPPVEEEVDPTKREYRRPTAVEIYKPENDELVISGVLSEREALALTPEERAAARVVSRREAGARATRRARTRARLVAAGQATEAEAAELGEEQLIEAPRPYARPEARRVERAEVDRERVPREAREAAEYAPVERGERGRWKPVRLAVATTGPQEDVLRLAVGEGELIETDRTKRTATFEVPGDPNQVEDLLETLDAYEGTAAERRAAANLAAKIRRGPRPQPERLVPEAARGRREGPAMRDVLVAPGGFGQAPTTTQEQVEFTEPPPPPPPPRRPYERPRVTVPTPVEELAAEAGYAPREAAPAVVEPEVEEAEPIIIGDLVTVANEEGEWEVLNDIPPKKKGGQTHYKLRSTTDKKRRLLRARQAVTPVPGSKPELEREAKKRQPAKVAVPRGRTHTARDAEGNSHTGRWAIVDLDNVEASNVLQEGALPENPRYPQELQPRDRSKATSIGQVQEMGRDYDPNLVDESADLAHGAPWIEPTGEVTNGNARVLALEENYRLGDPAGYRDQLDDRARTHGIDPAGIADMGRPALVVVREPSDDMPATRFAELANVSDVAELDVVEQARTDAGRLDADDLDLVQSGPLDGASNREFVQRFVEKVAPTSAQRGRIVEPDGQLSGDGLRRLENALLAAAYGDPELLGKLRRGTDEPLQRLANALIEAAPWLARDQAGYRKGELHPELDPSEDIAAAVLKMIALRKRYATAEKGDKRTVGQRVEDHLNQLPVEESEALSPEAQTWLRFFNDNRASQKKLRDGLRRYHQLVQEAGSPKQESMFPIPPPPRHRLASRAAEDHEAADDYVEPSSRAAEEPEPPTGQAGYVRMAGGPGLEGKVARAKEWIQYLWHRAFRSFGPAAARGVSAEVAQKIKTSQAKGFWKQNAITGRAIRFATQLQKGVRKEFDKADIPITKRRARRDHRKAINLKVRAAIESNNFEGLPEHLATPAKGMRQLLDELSTSLLLSEVQLSDAMDEIIEGNLGRWLRKTYRVHRDPKGQKRFLRDTKEGQEIWEDARRWLAEQLTDKYDLLDESDRSTAYDMLTDDEIAHLDGLLDSILAMEPEFFYLGRSTTASQRQDLSSLVHRKRLDARLRRFLGEDEDAAVSGLDGAVRVIRAIAQAEAQADQARFLREAGLLFDEKRGDASKEIGENMPKGVMGALQGKFTTPDLAKVLEGGGPLNRDLQTWIQVVVGAAKVDQVVNALKIVTAPMTHVANYLGYGLLEIASGRMLSFPRFFRNLPVASRLVGAAKVQMAGRLRAPLEEGDHERSIDFLRKDAKDKEVMVRHGVIATGVRGGELHMGIREAPMEALHEEALNGFQSVKKIMWRPIARSWAWLTEFYEGGDNSGHEAIFRGELEDVTRFADAIAPGTMEGVKEALQEGGLYQVEQAYPQLIESAAERTRATTPNYDELPAATRFFQRIPFFGEIAASWTPAIGQALIGSYVLAVGDIRGGTTAAQRRAGYARLVGTSFAVGGAAKVIQFALQKIFGFDDEDNENVQRLLAPWEEQRRMQIVDAWIDDEGNPQVTVLDMSRPDIYAAVSDPVAAPFRSPEEEGAAEVVADLADEYLMPFVRWSVLGNLVINLSRNQDEYGRDIYHERMSKRRIALQAGGHIVRRVAPSGALQAERVVRGIQGQEDRWGRKFRWQDEAWKTIGISMRTQNPATALSWRARDMGGTIRAAAFEGTRFYGPLERKLIVDEFVPSPSEEVHIMRSGHWNDLLLDIRGTKGTIILAGFDPDDADDMVEDALRAGGLNKKIASDLVDGEPYDEEDWKEVDIDDED